MDGIRYHSRIGILRLGGPLGGSQGSPAGRGAATGIKKLSKNLQGTKLLQVNLENRIWLLRVCGKPFLTKIQNASDAISSVRIFLSRFHAWIKMFISQKM